MACQLVVRSVELRRGQQAASKGLCHDQLCVVRRCVNLIRGERAPQSCCAFRLGLGVAGWGGLRLLPYSSDPLGVFHSSAHNCHSFQGQS